MTFRRRRPDDWATSHARARAGLSDRLDGEIEPSESGWLDDHLASCEECRGAAADYETQRTQLRAAREDPPGPPRDLWARTAAAIEQESSFRDRRRPARGARTWLRSSLLATALVVAVAVGTLFSSQLPFGGGHAASSATASTSATERIASSTFAGPTPIPVGEHVQWISRDANGRYRLTNWDVQSVCPSPGDGCTSTPPVQDQPVGIETEPQSVFGSRDGKQLIVVNPPDQTNPGVSVVSLESQPPASPTPQPTASDSTTPSSTPTAAASSPTTPPTPTPTVSATGSVRPTSTPSVTPTPTPSGSAAGSPPPSVAVSPSATPGGPIQIAQDVVLVGQSAAYSPDNEWFAFTARPADGKTGPDIYLWRVGQPVARPVTTDHHSAFGSWTADNDAVGSSVQETNDSASPGPDLDAISFVLDPATGDKVTVPQAGRAWRPSVDPTGHRAIYWAGTLRRQSDPPRYLPSAGRLVLGDWNASNATASEGAAPTPLKSDQAGQRHETTIAAGQIQDWDARWDSTGSKVAVWIADANDPTVGSLSLYSVDTFDGRIDLKKPLLDSTRADAGFSMSDGKLVWAEPDGTAGAGRVLVLAWTDQGTGTIETASDQVVVVR